MDAAVEARLVLVPPADIEKVWPHVAPGIAEALESSNGEASVEDTKVGLVAGRTQLLLMEDGGSTLGVVFMFLNFPQFKIARVLLLFGEGMERLRGVMAAAETWGKSNGCRYVEAWVASESRERLFGRFGYEPTYRIVRKSL